MKTKRRRGPRFVRVAPVVMPDGDVLLYAVDTLGQVWERGPGTAWILLPAGGGK